MAKQPVTSMTGYGRGEAAAKGVRYEAEFRSVNNRHLDIILRIPPLATALESELREVIGEFAVRGRVELTLVRIVEKKGASPLQFDKQLFDQYLALYTEGLRRAGVSLTTERKERIALEILNRREVLAEEPAGSAQHEGLSGREQKLLLEAVRKGAAELRAMRQREGARLVKALKLLLAELQQSIDRIATRAPEAAELAEKRLRERVSTIAGDIPMLEPRVVQEVALLLERLDISEEVTRARSHLQEFGEALAVSGNGRRLDFLVQEITRELNTMASKAQDAEIQRGAVLGKSILEKLREQIQNLE